MINKVFFHALIFFTFCGEAVAEQCIKNEKVSNQSLNQDVAHLVSQVCYIDDSTGYVNTEIVFRRKGKKQIIRNNFEGVGYVVSVDESIDINGDGIPDLAISNGAGRGGEGFDYWWYDKRSMAYKKLGEFSHLQPDKVHTGIFFNLISSGDQYYSRRYNYTFQQDSLKLQSAYGFKSCANDASCTEIVVLQDAKQSGLKKTLSEKELNECMAGTGDCL